MGPKSNGYDLKVTNAFLSSVNNEIHHRRHHLKLSVPQIRKFSDSIRNRIRDVATLPHSHENIANKYNMKENTYEVLIGKHYAIFYRINEDEHSVIIGSLFNNRQMKLSFMGIY